MTYVATYETMGILAKERFVRSTSKERAMFNPKLPRSAEFWLGSDKRFGMAQDKDDAGTDHIYMFTAQGLQQMQITFIEHVEGVAQ